MFCCSLGILSTVLWNSCFQVSLWYCPAEGGLDLSLHNGSWLSLRGFVHLMATGKFCWEGEGAGVSIAPTKTCSSGSHFSSAGLPLHCFPRGWHPDGRRGLDAAGWWSSLDPPWRFSWSAAGIASPRLKVLTAPVPFTFTMLEELTLLGVSQAWSSRLPNGFHC